MAEFWPISATDQADLTLSPGAGRVEGVVPLAVDNIIPRKYKLFGWQYVESDAHMDAEFMKPMEDKGALLKIKEKQQRKNSVNSYCYQRSPIVGLKQDVASINLIPFGRSRQPHSLVPQLFWRPVQPHEQELFNHRSKRARRRN